MVDTRVSMILNARRSAGSTVMIGIGIVSCSVQDPYYRMPSSLYYIELGRGPCDLKLVQFGQIFLVLLFPFKMTECCVQVKGAVEVVKNSKINFCRVQFTGCDICYEDEYEWNMF